MLTAAALASEDGVNLLLSMRNKFAEETGLSDEEAFLVGFALVKFMVASIVDQLRNADASE